LSSVLDLNMQAISENISKLARCASAIIDSLRNAFRITPCKFILLFLVLNFWGANILFSQTSNPTEENLVETKHSISGSLMKTLPGLSYGISYERMFYHRVKLEIGMGLGGPWLTDMGITFGSTVYPFQKARVNEVNFYTGIRYTGYKDLGLGLGAPTSNKTSYIPIGFTFFIESIAFISIDIGPAVRLIEQEGRPFRAIDKSEYSTFWNAKLGVMF